jgi:hypothetical protein
MIRQGVGKFLVKGDEVQDLFKKLKNLKVPVTVSQQGDGTLVVVNMGRLDPTEYRKRCERLASVLLPVPGSRRKRPTVIDWVAWTVLGLLTTCLFWG